MQTELLQKDLKTVGEAISHGLGAQMVKDFQVANPTDTKSYFIGRNVIDQILAQPGCAGIRFYNAYNEKGEKTLVYLGVDEAGKSIVKYTVVSTTGQLVNCDATMGDRTNNGSDDNIFEQFWEFLTAAF